jgi:Domain of unknown function (DUF222)
MFEDLSVRAVESELVELAGHLAAGTYRFLQLLAEFDERDGWEGPGLRSCAHWLNWRVGLSLRTAREHLRVAHALRGLPETSAAFAAGRVSYAKVRALTRIATADSEHGLLSIALHGTASQVESAVAAARAGMDPRPAAARRGMRWSRTGDGSLVVSLRIPAAEGAQLVAAVEALLAEDADADTDAAVGDGSAEPRPEPEQAPGTVADPIAARRLDALLDLVTGRRQTPETTMVVHLRAVADEEAADVATDAEAVCRPAAWIEGGPVIHPTVAARLTCTAAVQALLADRRGNPLYLGRRRRTVSPAQLRALRIRDRDRCVFPGCTATRHLQAHHLRWWRYGGSTDLDNLALVCTFHHTLVHEQGYQQVAEQDGRFTATCPDGTPIPRAGAPTHGDPEALRVPGIDDRTITPRWGGERLDRDHLLAWLLPTLRAKRPAAA